MSAEQLEPVPREDLIKALESILFVAEEPVSIPVLARTLQRGIDMIKRGLDELEEQYTEAGIKLQRTQDQVQLVSAPEFGPYVERFLGIESRQRLSGAALEALAIVAYKQPVTRAAVENVRGVNSDAAIASLVSRGLVEEVDRAPTPGRPALFATTLKFLEHFGLTSPAELPPLNPNGEQPAEE